MSIKKTQTESVRRLCETIAKLNNVDDCYAFLLDLCTVHEIEDMAQRLDTAVMLDAGESYLSICDKVGISTATISRVSRALAGKEQGYRHVIDAMTPQEKEKILQAIKK